MESICDKMQNIRHEFPPLFSQNLPIRTSRPNDLGRLPPSLVFAIVQGFRGELSGVGSIARIQPPF